MMIVESTTDVPLRNSAASMLRDFLDEHSLTEAKLAADFHISPQLLNEILASRRLLTTEDCLKLGATLATSRNTGHACRTIPSSAKPNVKMPTKSAQ